MYPEKFSTKTQGATRAETVVKLAHYYRDHATQCVGANTRVVLLSNNYETFKGAEREGLEVFTLVDFIKRCCPENVDLLDYVGLQAMDVEESH